MSEELKDVVTTEEDTAAKTAEAKTESMDDFKEELEASFKKINDNDDNMAWYHIKEMFEAKETLTVTVSGVVNAGVIAEVEGIRGFIPASKLSLSYVENLEDWLNKEIEVRIITAEPENNKLVLSARDILKEKAAAEKAKHISEIEIGLITEGKVQTIQPYGAFVDLGNGISGLVHISQICQKRIKTPAAVVAVGDTVKVKVIGIKDGKISLSMKALNEEPEDPVLEEDSFTLPKSDDATTNLGSLFANLKFK